MVGMIKEMFTGTGYAKAICFETKDMFNHNKTIKPGTCFVMSCDTVPCGTYPTWYGFTEINMAIGKFIFENGISEIIIGNHKFIIDIRRDDVDNDIETCNSFREAYFRCLSEDEMYN